MNNLIELGRETFEFAHSSIHDRARTNTFTQEERSKLKQAAKKGERYGEKYGSTAAGAGAGALAGAGAAVGGSSLIAKRRRAEKNRIKNTYMRGLGPQYQGAAKKKPQGKVDKRTKAYKDSIKTATTKKPPTPSGRQMANSRARADMRRKYGKNWYRPGGSKKKLLGYGALAGAALGGAAGYYARKKKGDS